MVRLLKWLRGLFSAPIETCRACGEPSPNGDGFCSDQHYIEWQAMSM